MTWLKFYAKERKVFTEEDSIKLTIYLKPRDLEKIARKIAHHFKFRNDRVFVKNIRGSYSNKHGSLSGEGIVLSKNNGTLLVFIHELAHNYEIQHNKNRRHNKALLRTMRRMFKYCKKNKCIKELIYNVIQ